MISKITPYIIVIVAVSILGFVTENIWIGMRFGYFDNRGMMLPGLLGYGNDHFSFSHVCFLLIFTIVFLLLFLFFTLVYQISFIIESLVLIYQSAAQRQHRMVSLI